MFFFEVQTLLLCLLLPGILAFLYQVSVIPEELTGIHHRMDQPFDVLFRDDLHLCLMQQTVLQELSGIIADLQDV